LPDPNASLQTKTPPKPEVVKPETVKPAAPPEQGAASAGAQGATDKFSLYNLLPGRPPQATSAPAKEPVTGGVKEAAEQTDRVTTFLQVGAYENDAEADTMSAKLALMGFEAKTSTFERDGKTLRRVRIGPLRQQEEVERIRTALRNNHIEASVVRVPVDHSSKPAAAKKTSPKD
jgi:cell division protein FtsN